MEPDAKVFARVKRLEERWIGDDRFRAALAADPAGACASLGLDHEPLSFLWDRRVRRQLDRPEVHAHQRLRAKAKAYLDLASDDTGAAEAYRGWRARQRARSEFAQGFAAGPLGLHLPFAVELTQGCSIGCWFCGVSASPLRAALPADMVSWKRMLVHLRGIFGRSAVCGALYWATDPLDHPDYCAFAEVFRQVNGRFPATTTAAPLRDLERTRELMRLARDGDSPSLRFSVLTRRQIDRLHAEFSPEELADVDLVMVNRESVLGLAEAGAVRAMARKRPERVAEERRKLRRLGEGEAFSHRTIACVSGFLIEPLAQRVRLISPEPSSDRWPDGYAVFAEESFDGAEDFKRALDCLVRRSMTAELPGRLALQRGVSVRSAGPGLARATGRGHSVDLASPRLDAAALPAIAAAFQGGACVNTARDQMASQLGRDRRAILDSVEALWRFGVLIEPLFDFADCRRPQG